MRRYMAWWATLCMTRLSMSHVTSQIMLSSHKTPPSLQFGWEEYFGFMHLLKSCSFSFQGNSYLFSPSRYSHYYQVQYNTSIVVCCFLNLVYSLQTLNEQQGGHSGCIMWPGCSFSYHGINVTHIERFKPNSNLRDKVDTAVKWMTHSYPQANLVMIYHDQPDQFGHVYGPNSPRVLEELKKVRCLP